MSVKKEQLPRRMHTVHVYESRGEWLFQGIIVFIMVVMSVTFISPTGTCSLRPSPLLT